MIRTAVFFLMCAEELNRFTSLVIAIIIIFVVAIVVLVVFASAAITVFVSDGASSVAVDIVLDNVTVEVTASSETLHIFWSSCYHFLFSVTTVFAVIVTSQLSGNAVLLFLYSSVHSCN